MPQYERRLASAEKTISELTPQDIRVALLGLIIHKEDNSLILDDGTGKIQVSFEELPKVELNQVVRVFGRVIPIESGVELQGEILQDMSSLDRSLRSKIQALNK